MKWWLVAALFLLAFGPRLGLAIRLPSDDTVFVDRPYVEYARNLAEGRGFWASSPYPGLEIDRVYAYRPPLFPFLWGCVYGITKGAYAPIRVAHALISALACLLAFAIGRELFEDDRVALVGGTLAALYPPLIWHSVHLMTEPLFIFLSLAAFYALLRSMRGPTVYWAILAGALFGLATLSRSVAIGFVPLAGIWLWWCRGRSRKAAAAAFLLWATVAVVMAPWWVRNYRRFGRFVPSTTDAGHGFYVANNEHSLTDPRGFWLPGDRDPRPGVERPPAPRSFAFLRRPGETVLDNEVEISRRLVRTALKFWADKPGTSILLMARRFGSFWRPWPHVTYVPMAYVVVYGVSFVPCFLLMIPGFAAAWLRTKGKRERHFLVLLLVVFMTGIHTLVLAMSRYRVPLMPVLLMYTAYTLVAIWDRFRGKRRIPVATELRQFDRISEEYDASLPAYVQDHYLRLRARVLAPLLGGGKGLDVGCGTGRLMERLAGEGHVFGVDGSNGMLIVLKDAGRGAAAKAVTRALPFENDALDVVWCVAVLHHLGSAEMVASTIREMARVTKPGGHIVIWDHNPSNPYWPIVMSRVPQDTGGERLVSASEIDAALEQAGIAERTQQRRGFVPDFTPGWLLWLFQAMEFVVERTPLLSRIAAHNVFVGRKAPQSSPHS